VPIRARFGSGDLLIIFERITPGPDGRLSNPVEVAEVRKEEGVHNVHTLGFGSGRTGGGLGRIAEVFGEVAEIQGLESGSSPTSGTISHVRGVFCF
jgi:hypothetical protein